MTPPILLNSQYPLGQICSKLAKRTVVRNHIKVCNCYENGYFFHYFSLNCLTRRVKFLYDRYNTNQFYAALTGDIRATWNYNECRVIAVAQPVIKIFPAMPGGTLLTLEERAKVDALSQEELAPARISVRIKRTVNVVRRYLNSPTEYEKRLFTRGNQNWVIGIVVCSCVMHPSRETLPCSFEIRCLCQFLSAEGNKFCVHKRVWAFVASKKPHR